MSSSRIYSLFAFVILALTFASATTTNSICLREVNGYIFNLCPFKNPINILYNTGPLWSANFTLSFLDSNIPSCNSTSVNGWMTSWNSFGQCANVVTASPVFNYTKQDSGLPGLKISYNLDNDEGTVAVNLLCNQTGLHNANIDFFVEGDIGSEFVIAGYSYYACPVKAAGRKFLKFDDY